MNVRESYSPAIEQGTRPSSSRGRCRASCRSRWLWHTSRNSSRDALPFFQLSFLPAILNGLFRHGIPCLSPKVKENIIFKTLQQIGRPALYNIPHGEMLLHRWRGRSLRGRGGRLEDPGGPGGPRGCGGYPRGRPHSLVNSNIGFSAKSAIVPILWWSHLGHCRRY